jgi:hypothetical protein
MTELEVKAQAALDSLTETVAEELDRKRRLGQYAVIWRDGKVVRLFSDDEASDTARG